VERLLEAHPQVGDFMQGPAAGIFADEASTSADRTAGASSQPVRERLDKARTKPLGSHEDSQVRDLLTRSDKPDSLGRLDHYEIQEIVGRGGMGVVLKGFDEKLHRVVAIKVLAPERAASGTARQRFTREARAAAAVSHEHVVTIHAVEEDHQPPFLVMQFIDGVSLQQKLDQQGALGPKEILRIGMQTAAGLAAAHRQGLVHRDIKPANILLENAVERVKLTDFGLARAVDDANLTQSGVIAGTPQYMSPEQAASEPIDHRSDLFSLGSVLYAMCTGQPPFKGDSVPAILRRIGDDEPRPLRQINPDIPEWLAEIVARLLAKNPTDRFPSAYDVAELLSQHLAHVQQPSQSPMPKAVKQLRSAKTVRKRRWAGLVSAVLILLGLSCGLYLAYEAGWLPRSPHSSHSQYVGSQPVQGKAQPIAEKKPVAEEVLNELRRLVTAQAEAFQSAQLNFEVGRGSPLDFHAEAILLIEARIKLATAEQKSVIPLLEDLVRHREEELRIIQARSKEGLIVESDASSARARLSDARARLTTARAELSEKKP
jgi:serine/threonine-protein kinase